MKLGELHIVITDQTGDTALSVYTPISDTEQLNTILREPFIISRLLEEASTGIQVKAELDRKINKRIK